MRIKLVIDGGFVVAPGLAKPIDLDDSSLAPSERIECGELVRAAIEHGNPGAPASPAPDARNYQIQIDDDQTTHRLSATDVTMPPAYSNLIKFVRQHGSR